MKPKISMTYYKPIKYEPLKRDIIPAFQRMLDSAVIKEKKKDDKDM